jgi:Beta protein
MKTMFGPKHYVPILKWKRAEQKALGALSDEQKQYITPVIQFVMPKPDSSVSLEKQFGAVISKFQEKMPLLAPQILKFWGSSPVFVDFSLLYTTALKIDCLATLTASAHHLGLHLIPVLHLSDDAELKKSMRSSAKKYSSGICLRLVPHDLADIAALNKDIKSFLGWSGLTESDVDLLVDAKEIEDGSTYAVHAKASQKINDLSKWRTFIFASGAFPSDLMKYKIDEENLIPRLDWKYWLAQIGGDHRTRKPTFADYTIQHPIYKESSQFFPPTTSIRYALKDQWLIMKGRKQKFELYLANAKLLADDPSRFFGGDFSFGDKYIAEKAKHYPVYIKDKSVKGTGSTESWLTAGINHHLVLTAHQIANLP